MRSLLFILLVLTSLPGVADIYKCKDARQVVVYQDTPCAAKTIGTLKPVPAPSTTDVLQARRDLERMMQDNRYYEKKRREEWAKKQEELRILEAQEMREQERLAAETGGEAYCPYIPAYGPGYRHRPYAHHNPHRHPEPVMPAPRRPCVIGYVGDKSCR